MNLRVTGKQYHSDNFWRRVVMTFCVILLVTLPLVANNLHKII